MTGLGALITRDCKLFFKDKGMFFTSIITPVILLVLYVTFLGNVYHDSFSQMMAGMGTDKLIDAAVGAQLVSSLLAVCCVTVAFCSNMLMVQDKVTGARRDLTMTTVRQSAMALGYYVATVISTLIVCLVAAGLSLLYLANAGWFMTNSDVLCLLLDVVLLVLFGTALSSIINIFLSSQGQISAVGAIISSGYGFICGAYMPISNFGAGLQKALSFLPSTYGTALIRNHALGGVYREMAAEGFPQEMIEGVRDAIDCNVYFSGDKVEINTMYLILAVSVAALIGIYILINVLRKENRK